MPNYEKMYALLFNAITDALRMMEHEQYADAALTLAAAQCQTEEMFLSQP